MTQKTVTLNTGSGTQQWTPPSDCTVIDKLELWGPGGSGAKETGARTTGGGAGAYNFITGPIVVSSLLVSGTVPYLLGQGGAAVSTANTVGSPGTAKTWFSAIGTYAADLGLGGGTAGSGTAAGGAGGLKANCVPTTNGVAGGNGGTSTVTTGASGGGASGSGNGAGVNGAAVTTAVAGAGGTAPSGGGNGGAGNITSGSGNAVGGSTPGGGGGAKLGATGNSGAGAIGQIVITYTPIPLLGTSVITQQEQPPYLRPNIGHWTYYVQSPKGPFSYDFSFDFGDGSIDRGGTVLGRQEQPAHPLPSLRTGVQGPNVRVPTVDTVLGRQEQPAHPLPSLRAGIQGPNVRVPTVDTVLGRQEQPTHPLPSLGSGLQTTAAAVPILTLSRIFISQEQPAHPLPSLRTGVQGPNVRVPTVDTVLGRQEQPAHPLPSLGSGYPFLASVIQTSLTLRQEQPTHPLPVARAGVYSNPVTNIVSTTVWVVTRQEQPPWYPAYTLISHPVPLPPPPPPPSPPVFAGRIVWLLPDNAPSLPSPAATRIVWLLPDQPPQAPTTNAARTVWLIPDEGQMQLPQLLQYGPTGPMDNDPFTIAAGNWLETIVGDTLASVTVTVTNMDDSPQSSVTVTAGPTLDPTRTMFTVWLTGGVPGTSYLLRCHLKTVSSRSDWKSVVIPVVADRS